MRLILNSGGMGGHPEGVPPIQDLFRGCQCVAVIPYAMANHDAAVAFMQQVIPGVPFYGIHKAKSPVEALRQADGIWCMGGNSFRLVDALHANGLIEPVRKAVKDGVPYAGASAGANVAGPTICTTNDMPIIRSPRSLDSFNLIPLQINPHYLDADAMPAGFRGETRAQRIAEFLEENDVPVIGLREGTWLTVTDKKMQLEGTASAVIFERGKDPCDVPSGSNLSRFLAVHPRFSVPQRPDRSIY